MQRAVVGMSHSTAELGNGLGPHKQCTNQLHLNAKRICARLVSSLGTGIVYMY